MPALVIVLTVLGFVIPTSAAVVAYRRMATAPHHVPEGRPTTLGDFNRWMGDDIPRLLRSRVEDVKWPALWALFGLLCSTVGGVLSVTSL